MTTQEEARKSIAKSRHQEEHIEKNMLLRSETEIEQSFSQEIEAEARNLMAEKHQQNKHIKETMLSRSEAEIENAEA